MPKWSSFRDLAIMRSRSPGSREVTLKVTGDSVFRFITWVVSACTLCHCRECCGVIFPCELVTVMMGIPIGDVDDEDDWEQMRVEIAYGTPWHGGLSTNLTSLYKQGPWVYLYTVQLYTLGTLYQQLRSPTAPISSLYHKMTKILKNINFWLRMYAHWEKRVMANTWHCGMTV